jgi:hypothetical protein
MTRTLQRFGTFRSMPPIVGHLFGCSELENADAELATPEAVA